MIVEWLIAVGSGFAKWIATLFPVLDIPPSFETVDDQIESLIESADGLSPWVDWGFVSLVLAIPLVVWVAGLVLRAVRALIAHIPFFGGKG